MFSSLKYSGKDDLGKASIVEAQSGKQLRRHESLWFEDGSIVLRAENTLFCVHMSLLVRHSEFFKDMFTIPQPEVETGDSIVIDGGPLRDGSHRIPVVTLFDSEEDVGNLLKSLYDIGPCVIFSPSARLPDRILQKLWQQRRGRLPSGFWHTPTSNQIHH